MRETIVVSRLTADELETRHDEVLAGKRETAHGFTASYDTRVEEILADDNTYTLVYTQFTQDYLIEQIALYKESYTVNRKARHEALEAVRKAEDERTRLYSKGVDAYEKAMKEWNSRSALYRWWNKNDKPSYYSYIGGASYSVFDYSGMYYGDTKAELTMQRIRKEIDVRKAYE